MVKDESKVLQETNLSRILRKGNQSNRENSYKEAYKYKTTKT